MYKSIYFSVCLVLLLLGSSLTSSAQIVFDPGSGTGSPAATLGPYTMTPVVDNRSANTITGTTFVVSPISGTITFSPGAYIYKTGAPLSWANGYTGKIYFLPNSNVAPPPAGPIQVSLPPNTKAFYLYASPANGTYNVTVSARNGYLPPIEQVFPVTAAGTAYARYFGFYINQPGFSITTITITAPDAGALGAAIGQFGIYQEPCPSASVGAITASSATVCAANPVRLSAPATGSSFIFTGPNGYVFSNVYRTPGSYTAIADGVTQPGTYTLMASDLTGCQSTISTITLTACP